MDTPETLKSRLYRLETYNDEDVWVEKCQGYPIFKKEDSIFKLRYYSLPNRELFYEIIVNSNIRFDKNQNGVEWIQIKQGEIMAISFKEEFSANAFWKMIDEYQKKYEVTVPAASGTHFYFEYRVPDPTVDNLNEFLAQIEKIPENQRHERLTSILLTKRQFLPHLYSVLQKLEAAQVQDLGKLQMLFKIMKIIFNASNEELLYELVSDEAFYSVLGALQYDPNFRNCRPNHREYMKTKVRMISVVQFKSIDFINLCIYTQRIEYLRECVLLPYLIDYSFALTSIVIRSNYKRIIAQIFNPKKKQIINDLFDHLRRQDINAYKFLREIFRIGKNISAEDFYLHIAERDFFDIVIRNMKQLKQIQSNSNHIVVQSSTNIKPKKKKKPQQIAQCVDISIQILEQFMEYEPLHFKNYCVSESETVSKYPTVTFLIDHYQAAPLNTDHKIENILRILINDKQNHPIKAITHQKILEKFLASKSVENCRKWIGMFNKIIVPVRQELYHVFYTLIDDRLQQILQYLLISMYQGPKQHQINVLKGLKNLIDNYIEDDQRITSLLIPRIQQFVNYFVLSKCYTGIRLSIFESIFKPKKLTLFVKAIIAELEKLNNSLLSSSIKTLKDFLVREEVILPTNLKRERSEQLQDDESFEKIQKKIKID